MTKCRPGDGIDTLNGGAGAESLRGGGGSDRYVVDNTSDIVFDDAASGSDTVVTSVSYALLAGQPIENLATADETLRTAINLTGTPSRIGGNDTYFVDNSADEAGDTLAVREALAGLDPNDATWCRDRDRGDATPQSVQLVLEGA